MSSNCDVIEHGNTSHDDRARAPVDSDRLVRVDYDDGPIDSGPG